MLYLRLAIKSSVKAGTSVIAETIQIRESNVHIQGEGMGITNIVADVTMTASPAIEAYIRWPVAC
jgi:hypothetical protein